MKSTMIRLHKKFNRRGQATTELAVFGFVMLIALASLLRYGQLLNQQQEMRMHAFRKALGKAYDGYGAGGLGGASYTSLKNMHLVSVFNDYYNGSQRTSVSGGGVVLWDPDLMYADSGDKPSSYIEVDGDERNLGTDARRTEITTGAVIDVASIKQSYHIDSVDLADRIETDINEHLETTVTFENRDDLIFERDNEYKQDETWTTPW